LLFRRVHGAHSATVREVALVGNPRADVSRPASHVVVLQIPFSHLQ
jgi:hypothetical protein